MPRGRIFGIYTMLVVFALGAGLLVARFFGSTTTLPSGYATPSGAVSQAATATAPGQLGQATAAPEPTGAPPAQTAAPAGTQPPSAAPATDTTLPSSAPETATATLAPTETPTAAPTETPTTAAASNFVEYTVQKGDSLKGIAEKYNVTIRDIMNVNEIPNPDSLVVGSVLRIPKK